MPNGQLLTMQSDDVSLVFFSRRVPKKNLLGLLRALAMVTSPVQLSIAGPIEDAAYWEECGALIHALPPSKVVRYLGSIEGSDAVPFLRQFDLFVLPTHGENFGHVILESLAAGTPALVGVDTPWKNLEMAGAGWLCEPGRPDLIAARIDEFCRMTAMITLGCRAAARAVAAEVVADWRGRRKPSDAL